MYPAMGQTLNLFEVVKGEPRSTSILWFLDFPQYCEQTKENGLKILIFDEVIAVQSYNYDRKFY